MSFQVTIAFVEQYKANITLLLQQMGSRLRPCVTEDTYVGQGARAVTQVGAVKAQKRTTRHGDMPLNSTPFDGRWIYPTDYELADLIDSEDRLRLIVDPTSMTAMNQAMAMGRAQDDSILQAFFSNAATGQKGTVSTAFPATQQVAANVGATGNTGLNIAKLRAAKKILIRNQVDIDRDELYVALTSQQHDDLLNEAQAISLDYNTRPVLVDGRINSFMGFNFKLVEFNDAATFDAAATLFTGGVYNVPCWAKSGMHLGLWQDMNASIDIRPDKSGRPWQVQTEGTWGATRLEEKRVVQIQCV